MDDMDIREWERQEELSQRRPGLFAGRVLWPRHDRYEIVHVDGWPYIVPAPGARLEYYRPFDYHPELLRDFITMAQALRETPEEKEQYESRTHDEAMIAAIKKAVLQQKAKAVLSFTEKYGPLGLVWHFIERIGVDQVDGDLHVWYDLTFPDARHVPHEEWVSRFFPNHTPPRLPTDLQPQHYGEPVSWIRLAIRPLMQDIELWEEFRAGGYDLYDEYPHAPKLRWQWIDAFTNRLFVSDVSLCVSNGHGLQLDWGFKSLLQAVSIMFLINITTENRQVRLCALPTCRRPFIATHPEQIGCSTKHSNAIRQRRWYERDRKMKKQAQQLYAEGATIEEIMRRLNATEKNVRRWLGKEG